MRADARANQEAVLDAAIRLIAEQGIEVPMRQVAEEAGVGIATLFRRFPTRADLVRAVLTTMLGRVSAVLERHTPGMAQDPGATWPALVRDLVALRPGALWEMKVLAGSFLTDDELVQRRAPLLDQFEVLIRQGVDAGVVRPDLTPQRVQIAVATVTRPAPSPLPGVDEDTTEWMTDLVIRGMRP